MKIKYQIVISIVVALLFIGASIWAIQETPIQWCEAPQEKAV